MSHLIVYDSCFGQIECWELEISHTCSSMHNKSLTGFSGVKRRTKGFGAVNIHLLSGEMFKRLLSHTLRLICICSFFFPFQRQRHELCLNFAGVWVKNEAAQPELKMTHLLKQSVTLHYPLFPQPGTGSRIKTCCLFFRHWSAGMCGDDTSLVYLWASWKC